MARAGWLTAGFLLVVAGAVVVLGRGEHRLPMLDVTPTDLPVPVTVRTRIALQAQPPFGVPPSALLDAYGPLENGEVYVYTLYRVNGKQCEMTYAAERGTLAPVPRDGSGALANCLPVTSSLPRSLSLGVAHIAGPLVLFGTAPMSATTMRLTTSRGATFEYALPHVAVRVAPRRQAVILDLTDLGTASLRRVQLLRGTRVLESNAFFP